jgi:mannose-6-phosphate isomerase-like protein (cupin superfamily)
MRLIAIGVLFAGFALPAGDPMGFQFWSATELKGLGKTLAGKINAQKLASQQMGGFGNYSFLVVHREGSGQAEVHETQADVIVVESGGGTLMYGGQVVNGKKTDAHEVRGDSIDGALEKKLAPGDIVTVPPKVPHLVKLEPGREITYFTVKVTQ